MNPRQLNAQLSQATKDALDLAFDLGGRLEAGTTTLAGRVQRTAAGTLRQLVKLELATAVRGSDPLAVILTDAGRQLAGWRAR